MARNTNTTVLSATTLIGDTVRDLQGDQLGSLEEIMLDLNSGQVAYAVLSFGGFLGIDDKYFAIPWQALSVDTENHEIVLDVDQDKLENAPGFDKDNWPNTADPEWVAAVHSYFGYDPYRI
jgi:sporulation protein YlmC with PRC-barrel domain